MSTEDRLRWDARYSGRDAAANPTGAPPRRLAPHAALLPRRGRALDLACGAGAVAVWLARRGLDVLGVDVSPVAVDLATASATAAGVGDRCRFVVWDLDEGLPPGPEADLVVCHCFRDARLDDALVARLAPGGVLVVVALSEVGAAPGRFRVAAGELPRAFAGLEVLVAGEGDGEAWLVARARAGDPPRPAR